MKIKKLKILFYRKLLLYLMSVEKEIDENGYFIKYNFVCIPEEYNKEYYRLKRTKSLNQFPDMPHEQVQEINKQLRDIYVPTVDIYTTILFRQIRIHIQNSIEPNIELWSKDILEIYDTNFNFYKDKLETINKEYTMIKSFSDIFINKAIIKKGYIEIIKNIKNIVMNSEIACSEKCMKFVEWLDSKLVELFNRKKNDTNKSDIKNKLLEHIKIYNLMIDLNNRYLKPQIDILENKKNDYTIEFKRIVNTFKEFQKLVQIQINKFFSDYEEKVRNTIITNWDTILKTRNIKLDFDSVLLLGNKTWGNIEIKLIFPDFFEFKSRFDNNINNINNINIINYI